MNFIDSLGSSGWTPFATALLHTLWQGGLVSALLYFHLKTVPADRPHLRYAGAVGALLAVLFGAFLTWAYLDHDFQPAQASVPSLENEAITNAPASEHGHLGPELAPISTSAAGDSGWE